MAAISIILAMSVLGIIIFILIHINLKQEKNIEEHGIEVDAVVTKVTDNYDPDTSVRTYITFVKFMGDDNNEHEARLINVSKSFPYGRKMKIKFLPGNYKYCLFISQQIN